MHAFKRFITSPFMQGVIGTVGAWYLRLVWATSSKTFAPADVYDHLTFPAIIAMWHGQHFLAPFIKRGDAEHKAKVLISRHRDGEVNARAAKNLGIGTIRGSGAHDGGFHKGGAAAFSEMIDALKDGYNIAMTADIPKVSRRAGLGVVKLAQMTGKPIYAIAIASSRRHILNNWDRTAINLPFSHIALSASEAIYVPADADAAGLEAARQHVENELNRLTALVYDTADRKGGSEP